MYTNIKIIDEENDFDYEYSSKIHNFKYYIKNFKISSHTISTEIYRYIVIENFKKIINDKFKLYNFKLRYGDVFPKWLMSQTKHEHDFDPVIPNGDKLNNKQLIIDISVLENISIKRAKYFVNELRLDKLCKNLIAKIIKLEFEKIISEHNILIYEYKSNKTDYIMIKVNIQFKDENEIKAFIFSVTKERYNSLFNKYKKVHNLGEYAKPQTDFVKKCFILLLRYYILESYNQQLAVAPSFYKYISEKYNAGFELFASSINSSLKGYFSLYPDIEDEFNSSGNFNNIKILKGMYVSNPPFSNDIMELMAKKILEWLESPEDVGFIVTIPAWDKDEHKYGKYMPLYILKESKYIIDIVKIEKKNSYFIDYLENKEITPVSVYVILLQNKKSQEKYKINLKNDIKNYWKSTHLKNQTAGNINYSSLTINKKLNSDTKINFKFKLTNNKIPSLPFPNDYTKKYFFERAKRNIKMNIEKNSYTTEFKLLEKARNFLNVQGYIKGLALYNNHQNTHIKYVFMNILTLLKISNLNKYKKLNNCLCIDLTPSFENNLFFNNRIKTYMEALQFYLIKNYKSKLHTYSTKILSHSNFDIYNLNNINNFIKNNAQSMDFILITGTENYFDIKEISLFSELVNLPIFILQLYILLNCQNKNGNAILYFMSTYHTASKEILFILSQYYNNCTITKVNDDSDANYIILNGFKSLHDNEIINLKDLINDIYKIYPKLGKNINLHDNKLRDEYFITKMKKSSDIQKFTQSILNIKLPNKFLNKIKSFEEVIIKRMIEKREILNMVIKYFKENNKVKLKQIQDIVIKEAKEKINDLELYFEIPTDNSI
jgi:hypothetical protein